MAYTNHCTTRNLLKALDLLRKRFVTDVTAIQFEDGSGTKFNIQRNGSSTWEFVDLSDSL